MCRCYLGHGWPLWCFLVVVLGGLVVLPAGAAQVVRQFHFSQLNGSSSSELSLMNTAAFDGGEAWLQLCGNRSNQMGQTWFKSLLQVRGFVMNFQFRISGEGSEGFALLFQSAAAGMKAEGPGGPGLGYGDKFNGSLGQGIPSSVAIEFDTFLNSDLGDPNDNHISVHTNNAAPNSASEAFSVASTVSVPYLKNSGVHSVKVQYVPLDSEQGKLDITMDSQTGPLLTSDIHLDTVIPLKPGGMAWAGFTAATGDISQMHELLSWDYTFLGETSAKHSVAAGEGFQHSIAGKLATFTVQGVDQFGNNMLTGGAKFSVELESQPGLIFNVTDNSNGIYSFSYLPTLSATSTTLRILQNGTNIKNSPQNLTVSPGDVYPPECVASEVDGESGLTGGRAGKEEEFRVQLRDKYGNNILNATGKAVDIRVTLDGPTQESGISHLLDGGDYSVTYTLKKAGVYKLVVQVNGQAIKGPDSYFITITPASVIGSNCIATNANQNGIAGVQVTFPLQLVDAYGNNITSTTSLPAVDVILKGPNQTTGTATYEGNGKYLVQYIATVSGNYKLEVTVDGEEIRDSPFSPEILPANSVYPKNCIAFGPNINASIAGNPSYIFIQTRDYFGNNITQDTLSLDWMISFLQSGAAVNISGYDVQWQQNKNVYMLAYNVTQSGEYTVSIHINGTAIAKSPFSFLVSPNVPHGPTSIPSGDALTEATTKIKETFYVKAKDAWGNDVQVGGANFSVEIKDNISGASRSSHIRDLLDGNYEFSYTLETSGEYMLRIEMDGLDVKGSPFMIHCRWGGLPTPIVILIGGVAVFFITIAVASLWVYRVKFRKRRKYTPLREPKE